MTNQPGERQQVTCVLSIRHHLTLVCAASTALCLAACGGGASLSRLVRTASPYERYADTLERAGLDETALGRDWVRAGEQALATAVAAELPFSETGYFPPDAPSAAAYRMNLPRGRRLSVEVTFESAQPGRLFVDLFETSSEGKPPQLVAWLAEDGTTFTHDVERDATYLLRIQPELLRGGRYTLVERTLSLLVFPIPSLSARAVQSAFGLPRDAGAREHEGVDIFAPRGTPVVATADGVARTATNALGGNVVWLYEPGNRRRFYYAHLDRWAIEGTAPVRAGDLLGFVGNTGNARTTSPHLHFGIYENGAIDPLPWLQPDDPIPPAPLARVDRLGELVRVLPARTQLREAASQNAAARRQLDRASVARVAAVSRRFYRVTLPDHSVGYLDEATVAPADGPLRRERLPSGSVLRELPEATAPVVEVLTEDIQADVLGEFGAFALVRVPRDRVAWVQRKTAT
jgi:murein DD-endopeptidase MepM/ murein hydrolase activator NlpD